MSSQPPNFIFFITDQQRADWLGCYGHKIVRTPNIDSIADNGTRFNNFFVASPVCMPNRASLLTGRYPTQHGLRYNGCTLPHRANTFVDVLSKAGYKTATIGKSHLQPFTDKDPLRELDIESRPIKEAWKPESGDFYQEEPERYSADKRYVFKTPYYGYQHVDMVTRHGDRCGGHYQQWFRETTPNWRELQNDSNQLVHNYNCPQAFRTPIPEDKYPTTYIKNQTIDYLKNSIQTDVPFFLFISFPDPHHPFNPPGKYWDMYSPDDFEVPLTYEMHQNPPPPMKWLHNNWKKNSGQLTKQTAVMMDGEKLKQAMALTAGMITMVDDAIGEIMSTLKETSYYQNTITCFNSDHGDYLGDYNMLLKGALPFKSITRVPFIWSDPTLEQKKSTNVLSSTLDISATILDRAGIAPYFGVKGKSLLKTLTSESSVRDELLVEFNDGGARLGFKKPARVRSLITKTHRFTIYLDNTWGELYDLITDPHETCNLWDDPCSIEIKSKLSLLMNQELISLMDESPRSKRQA